MDPGVSDSVPKEQRTLAAIVFTDVVGFSRLAAQNETRVFVALQRDLTVMTDLCRAHGGQVLNTMGDGMLLCFTSAVDAMSCAAEVQRTLHAQAKALPPPEVLHHRIGVHLGDIIVKGDNVFGDGVNVAARLQNDARADSIWYSSTVNDVIRNKLKLDSKYIGQRQFKNLGEPVKVWEIPPVGETEARLLMDSEGVLPPPDHRDEGISGGKAVGLVLICLVLIGTVVFMIRQMKGAHFQTLPSKIGKSAPPKNGTDGGSGGTTTNSGGSVASAGTSGTTQMSASDAEMQLSNFEKSYDFPDIVAFLNGPGKVLPDRETHLANFTKLDAMGQWLGTQWGSTTGAPVQISGADGAREQIYQNGSSGLARQVAGKSAQPIVLADLTPSELYQSVDWLGHHQLSGAPPADLQSWEGALAAEYQSAGPAATGG